MSDRGRSGGRGSDNEARAAARVSAPAAVSAAVLVAALAVAGCGATAGRPAAATAEAFLEEQGLRGRVALVEFGLVGCDLSDAGLDLMIRLDREKAIEGLEFRRVEALRDAAAAEAYFAAKGPRFPVVRDPDAAAARAFDATVYPTFVLIDKFGRVRYRGPAPDADLLADWADTLQRETADAGPDAPRFGVSALDVARLLDETRLPPLAGDAKPLRAHFGQQGLVAVFVDTTCPYSGEAVGDMAKVAAVLAGRQVACVLVNVGEPEDAVRAFYGGKTTGAPVLYDASDGTQQAWKIDAVPTVMLFGPDGTLVYRGKAVWQRLASAVEGTQRLKAGSVRFGVAGTEFG